MLDSQGHVGAPHATPQAPIVFTIAAKNFFGYVQTLFNSLSQHHPEIRFVAALCDEPTGFDYLSLPFGIVHIEDLGIPTFDEMKRAYNITELNTSIKPFVFSYLFEKYPGSTVMYIDPDILVVSRMEELLKVLDDGANCVLTPHILEPAEFAEMNDQKFLQYGAYNLGFCAFRDTPQVRRVMSWWGRRLQRQCTIDLPNGLFVDQKWADLLPSFLDRAVVLRHPGYNVAYWNLSQRKVARRVDGWSVNGQPLRFFHFSGNVIENEKVFSRHSQLFRIDRIGDLRTLLSEYRQAVFLNGHNSYRRLPYAFSWSGARGENAHTPEAVRVQREDGSGESAVHLPLLRARSLMEFRRKRLQIADVVARRIETEAASIPFDRNVFKLRGYCACCKKDSEFVVSDMYSPGHLPDGRTIPNWREHLQCSLCGLVNRMRASFQLLHQELSPAAGSQIYITETKTRGYEWLRQCHPGTVGSEYFGPDKRPGAMVDGVRHEDIQRLSFPDESFDIALTFDVLEHVPDEQAALREFSRCLKKGGALMITVPFHVDKEDHQIRAVLTSDGTIKHLMEPEYHGNPVDPEGGSLCFRYFGWKLLSDLRYVGFTDVQLVSYWSERLCYFGEPQTTIIARK